MKEMKGEIFGCGWSWWLRAQSTKEMKGKIFGWSSIDKENEKYLASKNDVIFCFNETLHLNFGV